jgi:hypothetical protein
MNFKQFILREDAIADAILNAIAMPEDTIDSQRHSLMRNTAEFSSDIHHRIMNLGVVKALGDQNMNRYNDVVQSIKKGISIKDLIIKVRGPQEF